MSDYPRFINTTGSPAALTTVAPVCRACRHLKIRYKKTYGHWSALMQYGTCQHPFSLLQESKGRLCEEILADHADNGRCLNYEPVEEDDEEIS